MNSWEFRRCRPKQSSKLGAHWTYYECLVLVTLIKTSLYSENMLRLACLHGVICSIFIQFIYHVVDYICAGCKDSCTELFSWMLAITLSSHKCHCCVYCPQLTNKIDGCRFKEIDTSESQIHIFPLTSSCFGVSCRILKISTVAIWAPS